jgi:hypothetical protein
VKIHVRVLSWAMVLAFAVAACGRTGLEDDLLIGDASPDASTSSPDAPIPFDSGVPATCGDHTCGAGETCANCSVDCGICAGCGDGTCSAGETCTSCPQDGGVCKS